MRRRQLKKILLGILLFLSTSVCGAQDRLGLFASISGVAKGDVLNVRAEADFRSKKMGSFPSDYPVPIYVENCKKPTKSTWCKVHPEALFEGGAIGWVNARYLKFSDQGYVTIKGKENNCYYALKCKDNKCEVVVDFKTNEQHEITSIKTSWISEDELTPSNQFGAMYKDQDGFCVLGRWVQDYFNNKLKKTGKSNISDDSYNKALEVTNALRISAGKDKLAFLIHPTKGVIVTWNVVFGGEVDLGFSREEIRRLEKDDQEKIHFGQTYGKGDDVFMTLHSYLEMLTRPISDISKIEKLKSNKRYTSNDNQERVGYEIFWINEDSRDKDFDWLGLVIILEKYEGQWYVVGLLRDRWTI